MRAGRPSQEKVFPAAPEATLSQQQAEDIVKAAASRMATRKVRQECTSEILRDEQMRVEKVGVAREVPPSNSSAQQLGIFAIFKKPKGSRFYNFRHCEIFLNDHFLS